MADLIIAEDPTLEDVLALDGRIFAVLNDGEERVLNFYRDRGRKYGVTIKIINESDPEELARASSREHADQILKNSNSKLSVKVDRRIYEKYVIEKANPGKKVFLTEEGEAYKAVGKALKKMKQQPKNKEQ